MLGGEQEQPVSGYEQETSTVPLRMDMELSPVAHVVHEIACVLLFPCSVCPYLWQLRLRWKNPTWSWTVDSLDHSLPFPWGLPGGLCVRGGQLYTSTVGFASAFQPKILRVDTSLNREGKRIERIRPSSPRQERREGKSSKLATNFRSGVHACSGRSFPRGQTKSAVEEGKGRAGKATLHLNLEIPDKALMVEPVRSGTPAQCDRYLTNPLALESCTSEDSGRGVCTVRRSNIERQALGAPT